MGAGINTKDDSLNLSENEIDLLKALGDSVVETLGGKQDLLARIAEKAEWERIDPKAKCGEADDPVGTGEYRAALASKLDWLSEAGWKADDSEVMFPEDEHFHENYRTAEARLIAVGWCYLEDGDLLFGTRRMWEWYLEGLRTVEVKDHSETGYDSGSEPKRYGILPSLLPDEYEALKASISERGVDVPIVVDQNGDIIDGFHRLRACDELGIFCPREVRHFDTEADKLELILRLNCRRRQLNRKQRRSVIEAYLVRDPEIADNLLAEIIGGVSKNTVAAVRSELEATCQIDKFDMLRGKDGKRRPVKYKKIMANTAKETEAALRVIDDLPANCAGKTIDIITAQRRARRSQNARRRDEQRDVISLESTDSVRLHHCPFQELEAVAGLSASSTNLIFTDIPYDEPFLDQLPELANLAEHLLVEGGLFVSYVGQKHVDKYMSEFGKHLKWGWMAGVTWGGPAPIHHPRQTINRFNPLLVFYKGEWTDKGRWVDSHHVNGPPEKEWHDWQKPLEDVRHWLRAFSNPGDLVIDVCAGGFTTALACLQENRQFIGCDVEGRNVAAGRERLRLNKELFIHLTDAVDLNRSLADDAVLKEWARWEGVSDELASHVCRDMPKQIKELANNRSSAA